MTFAGVFPFGQPSTERRPRRPERSGPASAFVLGVYPSALHVRWNPPRWLVEEAGVSEIVGALAVDVEPVVFWDGADAKARVDEWKRRVAFRAGDETGAWGHVSAAGNGTSGTRVRDDILDPLGLATRDVWFSDAVPWYFVKRSAKPRAKREQGDAMDADYAPLAARDPSAPPVSLTTRPSVDHLVRWSVAERREALRRELLESEARVLITLGEEARRVIVGIADAIAGGVERALEEKMTGYAEPGTCSIGGHRTRWFALRHPGQRGKGWSALHRAWTESVRGL